ncbi:hypothetical protein M422DRAFT_274128 [Sphaerobolus stellatus SS14]|uniref:Uncharacterized protein n=1 Tax=Sphaerobolus stellatus (strain SS14) TaxID=990650 RepID=A0A0C9UIG1_SPHS4|nr:hypothetical protein M422DRAFT_274128 [Sphaerobolus stellatus SS14]
MPSEQPDTVLQTLLPLELVDRHWLSEAYPHLALALLQPTFTGDVTLGQQWFRVGSTPRRHRSMGPSRNALYFISKKLLSKTNVNLPVDFAFTRLPHTCGYRKKFLSSKRAKSAVLRSQQAFMPLMAMVSFAIAIYPDGEDGSAQPAWYTYLRDTWAVDSTWLDALFDSCVANFDQATNPRVGAFVDMRKLTSANVLKELHRAGAPLWFCWGPPDTRTPPSQWGFITPYVPHTMDASSIILRTHQTDYATPSILIATQAPNHFYTEMHPRDFLEAQIQRQTKLLGYESGYAFTERAKRQEMADQISRPPASWKTKVFLWDRVGEKQWQRIMLYYGEVRWLWDRMAPTQRGYNSYLDDCHLCEAFDPYAPTYSDDPDNDDSHQDYNSGNYSNHEHEYDPQPESSDASINWNSDLMAISVTSKKNPTK